MSGFIRALKKKGGNTLTARPDKALSSYSLRNEWKGVQGNKGVNFLRKFPAVRPLGFKHGEIGMCVMS